MPCVLLLLTWRRKGEYERKAMAPFKFTVNKLDFERLTSEIVSLKIFSARLSISILYYFSVRKNTPSKYSVCWFVLHLALSLELTRMK